MARKLKDPNEKVMQRSIGFPLRQHLFFSKHPNFKPDTHCRNSIDKQIAEIDPQFLSKEEVEARKKELLESKHEVKLDE